MKFKLVPSLAPYKYIILALLTGIAILIVWNTVYSNMYEGFAEKIVAIPKCPSGARFFNDAKGDSFCCRGQVDAFKHTCSGTGYTDVCAHKSGVRDPRNPARTLVECASLIEREHSEDQRKFCPKSLPHYGSIGKCCQSGTDMDNKDCISYDNKDPKRYCKIRGPLGPGEQLCSDVILYETTTCPTGLERIMFTPTGQPAGQNARSLPACFSVQRNCVPDNVIAQAKTDSIGSLKDAPANWEFSCSQYEKIHVRRDLS
jgi:hypothetical protein